MWIFHSSNWGKKPWLSHEINLLPMKSHGEIPLKPMGYPLDPPKGVALGSFTLGAPFCVPPPEGNAAVPLAAATPPPAPLS